PAGTRLTAVGVTRAPRNGVSFYRRAHVDVYALDDTAGLNFDNLRLRLINRVRVISLWIANSHAHTGPDAAARTDQKGSHGQAIDAVNATIIRFIAGAGAAVERLYLPVGAHCRQVNTFGDHRAAIAVGHAPRDHAAGRECEIN